ncbi:MAG TPA: aa3-type cytochrome c oxidase subunit IV [Amaricoccus sp.]|nr:aa3-type cytochrome c oxidase subunit IV [Amaricoccus sp.]
MAATQQDEREGGDSPTSVVDHQRTFDGFIRFWAYLFGSAILVLIFLAIFNS